MIIDVLEHAREYYALGPRMETALRYLETQDCDTLTPGRHDIDGNHVYALVHRYQSKLREEGFWEAHHHYIDVQYVISGTEHLGYRPVSGMQAGPYDQEKDFYKLEGAGEFITLRAGYFAILKPRDAHMPGIALHAPEPVHKIVVKVRV